MRKDPSLPGELGQVNPIEEREEMRWDGVLVYHCYCNKLTQTSWLKTRQVYSLTVLEVRSPKPVFLNQRRGASRTGSSWIHWEENLFPCFLQLPVIIWNPWLVFPSFYFKTCHSHLCFCHHITFSLWLSRVICYHKILNLITSAKPPFPYKATILEPRN